MTEEKLVPAVQATILVDFSKQHRFGFYALANKSREFDRNGNVMFNAFPRDTPQVSGNFGSSIPTDTGDYADKPLQIVAKKGCFFEFVAGDISDYRNVIWVFPPEFSEANPRVKDTPLYKMFEKALLMESKVTQQSYELIKNYLEELPKFMEEWANGSIQQKTFENIKALAEIIQKMNLQQQQKPQEPEKKQQSW